jgi:hypothetical protein
MRLLNLAATSSLAVLVLTLGVDQLKADHEGWSGNQRGLGSTRSHQNNTQGNWWQRQPAQPPQAWPQPRTDNFFGWSQPQPELPRSQNIEPEAPPAKAPVIYTYRADPLVELADANLTGPESQSLRWRPARGQAQAVFEALKTGSSGVRVTEQQRDDIIAFYRERDFAPVWTSEGGQTPRAADLLDELAEADKHALAPEDYLPSYNVAGDTRTADAARARADGRGAALCHACFGRPDHSRPAQRLSRPDAADGGRPGSPRPGWPTRRAPGPTWHRSIRSTRPTRRCAGNWPTSGPGTTATRCRSPMAPIVKPGESDPRIPAIRERLAKLGHLALEPTKTGPTRWSHRPSATTKPRARCSAAPTAP